MSSSGISYFRRGENTSNISMTGVPLPIRERTTAEGGPCHGVTQVEEQYQVVVGRKPTPRALRLSTYTHGLKQALTWLLNSIGHMCSCCCCFATIFLLLIGLFIFCMCVAFGYGEPYTELQDVTLRNLSLSRTWELDSDLLVVFKAGNPSKMAGFKTRFYHTLVNASYHGAVLGINSSVPPFSLGLKSSRNLTTEVRSTTGHVRQLDEGSGLALQGEIQRNHIVCVRVNVDSHAKQKYLARTLHRWFNLTCVVNMTAPSGSEPGRLLSKSCNQTSTPPKYVMYLCVFIVCIAL